MQYYLKLLIKILIKIGSSQNIKERITSLKTSFEGVEPVLMELIDVNNHVKFESFLHKHEYIKQFYYEMQNKYGNSSRETYLVSPKELNEIIHIAQLHKNNFTDISHEIINKINEIENSNKLNEVNNTKLSDIYGLLLGIKNDVDSIKNNNDCKINNPVILDQIQPEIEKSIDYDSCDSYDSTDYNESYKIKCDKISKMIEIDEIKLEREKIKLEKERLKLNEIIELKNKELIKKNKNKETINESNNDNNKTNEKIDESSDNDTESSYDSDEDDIDLTTIYLSGKKMKYSTKVPYVYQYNPDNLKVPIKIHESPADVERDLPELEISPSPLRNSSKNNTIYKGFRWFFVKRTENPPTKIPNTVNIKKQEFKIQYVAMIDIKKTKILNVYPNQKEATKDRLMKANSFNRAIKQQSISSGHYWNYFYDCPQEMQDEYLKNNKLPDKYVSSASKKVQQICPISKNVLKTYDSNREVVKLFKMSVASLKKYAQSGELHNGYYWKIIE